jgi:hypothetical protein
MVSNVIAFVAGNNDEASDSSLSSAEIIECDSDCSECRSDNDSISMNPSSKDPSSNSSNGEKKSQHSSNSKHQNRSKNLHDKENRNSSNT